MKLKWPGLLVATNRLIAAVATIATTQILPSRRWIGVPRGRSSMYGVSASATMIVARCAQTSAGTCGQLRRPLASATRTITNNAAATSASTLSNISGAIDLSGFGLTNKAGHRIPRLDAAAP